ncbi:MAG TPA: Gfo/Idh/MocA family oxidoreductase [Thermoanaerobaculia bacterium]
MNAAPAPLGVGVIGCGTIARYQHLPNLRRLRRARLAAVADPDGAAREWAGRRYGVPAFATAEELLAQPAVQAVVIATPTHLHAELAVRAAETGKPFFLEKPIAASGEEAARLLAAAGEAGVVAHVGYNLRFQPLYLRARELLRSGLLGEVLAVRALFAEPLADVVAASWRARRESGGGVFLDLAAHHFDLVRWLLADELVRVESAVTDVEGRSATARLSTAGGVEVHVVSLYGAGPIDRVELVGRRATLTLDRHVARLDAVGPRRRRYGARRLRVAPSPALVALRLRRLLQPSWEPSFARALGAFVDAALGRPSAAGAPLPATLGDGAASLAAVLAAELAARRGVPTPVEPILA